MVQFNCFYPLEECDVVMMSESLVTRPISVEKCLDVVPNKFRLALVIMNRAKDMQMKAKPETEILKFAKKSVNRALYDLRRGRLDIPSLEEKIRKDLSTNNMFPKSNKNFKDDSGYENDDSGPSAFELKSDADAISDSSYDARDGAYAKGADEEDEEEVLEGVVGETGGDEDLEIE
jgi:DNA-directed RNA polymerase subunit K/omega